MFAGTWHLTISWVPPLPKKLMKILRFLHIVSCNTFLFYAESKKKTLQESPSFCSACIFWYVLFFKNLVVALHHGDNAFLCYFYICIKFKLSKIISTMKKCIISHLMWYVNYIIKNLFHDKNSKKLFERKKQQQKSFNQTCFTPKPSDHSKF